jgi:hypothetical protein
VLNYQKENVQDNQVSSNTWRKMPRVPSYRYPEENAHDFQVPSYLEENAQDCKIQSYLHEYVLSQVLSYLVEDAQDCRY